MCTSKAEIYLNVCVHILIFLTVLSICNGLPVTANDILRVYKNMLCYKNYVVSRVYYSTIKNGKESSPQLLHNVTMMRMFKSRFIF